MSLSPAVPDEDDAPGPHHEAEQLDAQRRCLPSCFWPRIGCSPAHKPLGSGRGRRRQALRGRQERGGGTAEGEPPGGGRGTGATQSVSPERRPQGECVHVCVCVHVRLFVHCMYMYRITGNFGGGFNLAILESTAKLKIAKVLSSVHAQYTMRINRQILNSPVARFGYFAKILPCQNFNTVHENIRIS